MNEEELPESFTVLEFLNDLHDRCGGLSSTERSPQCASRSELRRWIQKGSLVINDKKFTKLDEQLPPLILTVVLHPKGRRITFW